METVAEKRPALPIEWRLAYYDTARREVVLHKPAYAVQSNDKNNSMHVVFNLEGIEGYYSTSQFWSDLQRAVVYPASLIREYVWANNMLVGVFENGQIYFVRTDQIGRPVFATDTTGAKVWEASYLPFGGVQASSGPNPELRFPGQWFQSETGLHQNWMRDYDPTLGRYLQADPLGLVDGASIYGYALQNPGRYTDPRWEFV